MYKVAGLGWGTEAQRWRRERLASSRKGGPLLFLTSIAAWKSKEILNDGLFQVAVVENADGFPENVNPTVLGLRRRNAPHLQCFQQNRSSTPRENQSRLHSRLRG